MTRNAAATKKQLILELVRAMGAENITQKEIAEIQRRLVAQLGEAGRTSEEYIADVLRKGGLRVLWPASAVTLEQYEEEFEDLLHFSTLEDAEMCLVRMDDLWRKFRAEHDAAAAERVLEVARLGKRRAEMIARNPKVNAQKRAEKKEIVQWFRIWLETPDAFFDWLDLRKQSPEFRAQFTGSEETE